MMPPDFGAYWAAVDAELAAMPARAELEPLPFRSIPEARLFRVRLTSVASYRIAGYLSVPDGPGPFPALLETPRYGSVTNVAHVNDRRRFVVFTATHRGQRGSDQPYRAAYPGLLIDGIEDPERYIYRGAVADCLRAAEFLLAHPLVDRDRVAVRGENDLALLTAARRPGFAAAMPLGTLFYRASQLHRETPAYPLEEINDHLREHPRADVSRTLAYFDPVHHGPEIESTVLLPGEAEYWAPLLETLARPASLLELSNRGAVDADRLDAWLAERLGVAAMPRFDQHSGGGG